MLYLATSEGAKVLLKETTKEAFDKGVAQGLATAAATKPGVKDILMGIATISLTVFAIRAGYRAAEKLFE